MSEQGDAADEAFEDALSELEDLVGRAARGEEVGGEAEPAGKGQSAGLSSGERDELTGETEEAAAGSGGGSGKTEVMEIPEFGTEQIPVVEKQARPPDPIPVPPAADGSLGALDECDGADGTEVEPEGPFGQFAPSGIIRRPLRGKRAAGSASSSEGESAAPPERLPTTALDDSCPDGADVPTSSVPVDPGDVIGGCRRLVSLEGCADLRIPLLLEGIGGLLRMLRTGSVARPGTVAICGACPRAGTSTVAAAAALSLAEQKSNRVLLVDADFHSPSVAKMAGRNATGPDFRAVLKGEVPAVDAVLYAPSENLAVLPTYGSGRPAEGTESVAGEVSTAGLAAFLEAIREQFDYVIIDTGSVADSARAAEVAAAAGSAGLVVRSRAVSCRSAVAAKAALSEAGARVEGAVLTFAEEA